MKKILVVIALLLSISIMAISCRIGTTYTKCVAECGDSSDILYLACLNGDLLYCSLMVDIFEDNCKEACE